MGKSVVIDVKQKFGVTYDGVTRAVKEAAALFKSEPNLTVTIFIDSGVYHLRYSVIVVWFVVINESIHESEKKSNHTITALL